MKKKFSIASLVFISLVTMAATIQWYSQQPATTALADNMVIAVERPVPHGYLSTTLASLKGYTGTNTIFVSSNVFTTNLYTTNLYSSNVFTTNLFSTNAYITNLYSSNAFITNITVNNITSQTNYFTDLTVESNVTFNGKVTINNITVTNGITNLNLTANTIVQADANRAIASVPNGTGSLTNDGAGNFGWAASTGGDQVWTNDLAQGIRPLNFTNMVLLGTNQTDAPYVEGRFLTVNGTISDGVYSGVKMYFDTEGADTSYETKSGIYLVLNAGVTTNNSGTAGIDIRNYTVPSSYNEGMWSPAYGAVGLLAKSAPTMNYPWGLQQGISGTSLRGTTLSVGIQGIALDSAGLLFPGTNIGGVFGANRRTFDSVLIGAYVRVRDGLMDNVENYTDAGILIENNTTNDVPFIIARTNHANTVGKLTKDGVWQANAYVTTEQTWSGPTNEISVGEWIYTAYTPCAVTNIAQYAAGVGNGALLSITNASSSNITFTVHSPIQIPYGETSRSYTITNGNTFFGSFRKGAHGSVFVPRGFYNP